MAALFEQLEIPQQQIDEVKAEQAPTSFLVEPGVYIAEVDQAFIRTTDSGARMLEIDFILPNDQKMHWNTCTQSGDEKGNKTTYTDKNGKEQPLPGIGQMVNFLNAAKVPNPNAQAGKVKLRDDEIDALLIQGIQGKKLKLGVKQYENEYNGEVSLKNDILKFMDTNGKNKDGETIEEDVISAIEKNPVKRLKKKAGATTTTQSGNQGSESAPKGW